MTAHDFGGFLPHLHLGGDLVLPIYFVVVSFAFSVSLLWLVKRAERVQLPRNVALDLSLIVMVTGFFGARLAHVLAEAPSYYLEAPLRLFEIWKGGFVWYGGLIAAVTSAWAFLGNKRLSHGPWLDLFAPVASLGYALGRVACVLSGCCFGAVCRLWPDFPFRYPTQLFAVAWELSVLATLVRTERHRANSRWLASPGRLFALWIVLHSLGRLIMEQFRADERGSFLLGLSPSSWIALVLIAGGIIALKKPSARSEKSREKSSETPTR